MATLRDGGVNLVLAFWSPTIGAFFLWHGAISLVAVTLYSIKVHRLLPPAPERVRFSTRALLEVWRFAGGMLAINLLAVLLTQVDRVLLIRLLSLEDYGYYTLTATVAGGLSLVVTPITQTFYPHLVELAARRDEAGLIRAYHQYYTGFVVKIDYIKLVNTYIFMESLIEMATKDAENIGIS